MLGLGADLLVDLAVVAVLAFGLYHRRHGRRDLCLSFVALNVGVFTVVAVLARAHVPGLALGFGLFGVLSIIRLRSASVQQEEVGYYFVVLVLGLLGGLRLPDHRVTWLLDAAILLVMYVIDHPRLLAGARRAEIVLDRVYAGEADLRADLARRLDGEVTRVVINEVDYVRDVTVVDVRYRTRPRPAVRPAWPALSAILARRVPPRPRASAGPGGRGGDGRWTA